MDTKVEIRHFHLACGLGGGARGFNRGTARVGNLVATFRCLGGIDVDPGACRDFERLAGVPATCIDLFDRAQYRAFHAADPPPDWREATTADYHRAAGFERPHIVFASFPCKGFSGLLSETVSKTAKYQALNRLTLRGIWLALEAWREDPVELYVFENVPRIAKRGRAFLDQIGQLFRAYGYEVAETTHDCGEIGGLAQSRKRFLLVARHREKVPNYLYEPPVRPLRGVGEVLDRLPLPLSGLGGPMHRMPALQWKTWVRLAFVEAGSDWRSLNTLRVEDGMLADFGIAPEAGFHNGALGVQAWQEPAGTVTANGRPMSGRFSVADPRYEWHPGASSSKVRVTDWDAPTRCVTGSQQVASGAQSVADPRIDGHVKSVQLGVRAWDRPAPTIKGDVSVGGGPYAVADPRLEGRPRFNSTFRIVPFDAAAPAVAGPGGPAGGLAVADPRAAPRADYQQTKYRITHMDEPAGAVIAASTTGNGAFAVADPRPTGLQDPRRASHGYDSQAHYGVTGWDETSGTVPAYAKYDRGRWSVADPRDPAPPAESQTELPCLALPAPADRLVCTIRALDGTWHRPFTTLELAALQSLVDPEEFLELDGLSDSAWRERIGNAVPPDAAEAVAGVMGRCLLLAMTGETFALSMEPIWVQPVAIALSVAGGAA